MISSFFSKAKPIHFVIVVSILFLAFVYTKFLHLNAQTNVLFYMKQLALFGVCFFSIFIFDFFSGKNNLTKKSSYKILLFTLFMVIMPQTFLNSKILLANLFILLALRRIVSLRSKKQMKKKLFDAAFWISLATLLFFWSWLFLVVIFIALFLYRTTDIKNWIIPFTGVLTVALIAFSVLIITNHNLIDYLTNMNIGVSLDFSNLNTTKVIIAATVIFSYFVWSAFFYLNTIKSKPKSHRTSYLLIFITALAAILIIVLSPQKTGANFLFLFAPLSLIITNYLEMISEKWFKEVLLWMLIVTPFVSLLL